MNDPSNEPEPRNVPQLRPGPRGGKRDSNRRRRTKEICDAGLTLFLERGIESVTIDDIVRAASIAKGSFYRYFKDKTDLVAAIFVPYEKSVEDAFNRTDEALSAATNREELFAAYELLAESLAAILFAAPEVFVLYLQENRAPGVGARAPVRALADFIDERSISLTDTAHARGLLRPIDPRVSARSVVGAVEKLLHGVLTGEDLGDPTEIPETLIAMILNGLRPDAPAV